MFGQNSKSRLMFLVALIIGGIGACGQAYLLYHELANCLPYKMINFYFYRSIANVGIWVAPVIAVVAGLLFGLKRIWLVVLLPVILCPLVFLVVFKLASLTQERIAPATEGTTDFHPETAAQTFYSYTFSLALTGLIVGAVCIFLLSRFSKSGKTALP